MAVSHDDRQHVHVATELKAPDRCTPGYAALEVSGEVLVALQWKAGKMAVQAAGSALLRSPCEALLEPADLVSDLEHSTAMFCHTAPEAGMRLDIGGGVWLCGAMVTADIGSTRLRGLEAWLETPAGPGAFALLLRHRAAVLAEYAARAPHSHRVMAMLFGMDFRCPPRSVTLPAPPVEDVLLPDALRDRVTDTLGWLRQFRTPAGAERYLTLGRPHRAVLLLAGPPGSGKTTLALALARELNMPLAVFPSQAGFSQFVSCGGGCLCLIEDVERLGQARESAPALFGVVQEHGAASAQASAATVDSETLNFVDGIAGPTGGSVIVMSSNFPEVLPPALLRRADRILIFGHAEDEQIRAAVQQKLGWLPAAAAAFVQELRARTRDPVSMAAVAAHVARVALRGDQDVVLALAPAAQIELARQEARALAADVNTLSEVSTTGSGAWSTGPGHHTPAAAMFS